MSAIEQFTVWCSDPSGSAYTQPTKRSGGADTLPRTCTPLPDSTKVQCPGASVTFARRSA